MLGAHIANSSPHLQSGLRSAAASRSHAGAGAPAHQRKKAREKRFRYSDSNRYRLLRRSSADVVGSKVGSGWHTVFLAGNIVETSGRPVTRAALHSGCRSSWRVELFSLRPDLGSCVM